MLGSGVGDELGDVEADAGAGLRMVPQRSNTQRREPKYVDADVDNDHFEVSQVPLCAHFEGMACKYEF